jgi:hypothetical protein
MKHLSEVELVDLIEHALAPARAQHVERCNDCRARVEGLRNMLTRASEVDVPEPSPLFWEHFSSRVRESVREAVPDHEATWFGWLHHAGVKWALSAVVIAVAVAVVAWRTNAPTSDREAGTAVATNAAPVQVPEYAPTDTVVDVDNDAAWALVRAATDDVTWNDAMTAGVAAPPGAAETAALTLTPEERDEFLRLLRAESKRPGA